MKHCFILLGLCVFALAYFADAGPVAARWPLGGCDTSGLEPSMTDVLWPEAGLSGQCAAYENTNTSFTWTCHSNGTLTVSKWLNGDCEGDKRESNLYSTNVCVNLLTGNQNVMSTAYYCDAEEQGHPDIGPGANVSLIPGSEPPVWNQVQVPCSNLSDCTEATWVVTYYHDPTCSDVPFNATHSSDIEFGTCYRTGSISNAIDYNMMFDCTEEGIEFKYMLDPQCSGTWLIRTLPTEYCQPHAEGVYVMNHCRRGETPESFRSDGTRLVLNWIFVILATTLLFV